MKTIAVFAVAATLLAGCNADGRREFGDAQVKMLLGQHGISAEQITSITTIKEYSDENFSNWLYRGHVGVKTCKGSYVVAANAGGYLVSLYATGDCPPVSGR